MDANDIIKLDTALAGKTLSALAKAANSHGDKAESLSKEALYHAVAAGKALIAAKGQLEHGKWQEWLEANWSRSVRTARRFMQFAGADPEIVSQAKGIDEATTLLSKPKTKTVGPDRFETDQDTEQSAQDQSFEAGDGPQDEQEDALEDGEIGEDLPETNFHRLSEDFVDLETVTPYMTCWIDPNWREWGQSKELNGGYCLSTADLTGLFDATQKALDKNTLLVVGCPPRRIASVIDAVLDGWGSWELQEVVPCYSRGYADGAYLTRHHLLVCFARGNRSLAHYRYDASEVLDAGEFIKSVSAGPMLKYGGIGYPGFDLGLFQ